MEFENNTHQTCLLTQVNLPQKQIMYNHYKQKKQWRKLYFFFGLNRTIHSYNKITIKQQIKTIKSLISRVKHASICMLFNIILAIPFGPFLRSAPNIMVLGKDVTIIYFNKLKIVSQLNLMHNMTAINPVNKYQLFRLLVMKSGWIFYLQSIRRTVNRKRISIFKWKRSRILENNANRRGIKIWEGSVNTLSTSLNLVIKTIWSLFKALLSKI